MAVEPVTSQKTTVTVRRAAGGVPTVGNRAPQDEQKRASASFGLPHCAHAGMCRV
jgi:hypothetical protein